MKLLPCALLLLLLVISHSAVAGPTDIDITVEPLPQIAPLAAAREANVTIAVPCAIAAEPSSKLEAALDGAPAWTNAIVTPTSLKMEPSACGADGKVVTHALLKVSATDQAPADAPGKIGILVTASGASGQTQGRAQTPIVAGYFPLLDAQLTETTKIARPDEDVVFPLKVTNLGNGDTVVEFSWTNQTFIVANVPGATLGSKQQGESAISAEVPITIHTAPQSGYVNRVDVITINYTSHYAKDPMTTGDHGTLSLVVTTRGGSIAGHTVAASPLPLVLGVVGAVAMRRRRT